MNAYKKLLGDLKDYKLPLLLYEFDALEPYIDARTMEIHYTKHHQAYLTNFLAIEGIDLSKSIIHHLTHDERAAVQNQGGGYINHHFFWKMMKKQGGGEPRGHLRKEIDKKWGSFDAFKEAFTKAAMTQFGSGWAWLVKKEGSHELEIRQCSNQNWYGLHNIPVLGVDVWEHAYYLYYQNRRADYLKAFLNVIDWDMCEALFES